MIRGLRSIATLENRKSYTRVKEKASSTQHCLLSILNLEAEIKITPTDKNTGNKLRRGTTEKKNGQMKKHHVKN